MKAKTLLITTVSLIFMIVVLLFFLPSRNEKLSGDITMLGNNYANLLVGGKVAKRADVIYYSCSSDSGFFNNISTYDLQTGRTKTLRKLVSIPTELCVSSEYVFFKKGAAYATESPLYRMNIDGGRCKTIISKSIGRYNICSDKIYYTLESPEAADDVGLFQCNLDGKNEKRIVYAEVDEFVVFENDIYYIHNNAIRHYNLVDGTDVEIAYHPKCSLYHLTINPEGLFYVRTRDENHDEESLIRFNFSDNKEMVLYDGKCGFIHVVNDMVIFYGEDEYYVFNLNNLSLGSFAETYNIGATQEITELYIFDSQCFFFVGIENGEKLVHLDLHSREAVVINER